MSKSDSIVTLPKSMRHKLILDKAADNPETSTAALANEVPSATTDLIENVLEKYGIPPTPHPSHQHQPRTLAKPGGPFTSAM